MVGTGREHRVLRVSIDIFVFGKTEQSLSKWLKTCAVCDCKK